MKRRSIIFAVAAASLMALPALAVDGATPIPNTALYATPIVINQPGSYVVTRNLTPTGPGPIIDIALGAIPGGVELDLNGFLLDNTPNPVNPVIQVSSAGAGQEVVIRNGSTMGGANGILAPSPGLPPLPRRVVIEDVYVSDTTGDGIRLEDMEVYTVRRCQVRAAQGIGILVWDTGGIYAKQGLITDNHVRQTADGIVVMSTQSIEVSNNRVKEIDTGGFNGVGIYLDINEAALVTQNVVEDVFGGPLGVGIYFADSRGKIYNNVVRRALNTGIELTIGANDTLVLDNVVRESGGDGMFIDGRGNHVERNVLSSNGTTGTGHGLHFGGVSVGNSVGRNSAFGNPGGPCLGFATPDFCDDTGPFPGANFTFGDNLLPGPGPI